MKFTNTSEPRTPPPAWSSRRARERAWCLARIASDAVTLWGGRVLILAHVKDLLEQNADKVRRLCPEGNNLGTNLGIMGNNEACPASFRALARPQLRRGIF